MPISAPSREGVRAPPLESLFAVPAVEMERRGEDSILLRHPNRLETYDRSVCDGLRRWAKRDPGRVWLAERANGGGWTRLTFGEAVSTMERVATWLLNADNLPRGRPVLILSHNSIDCALLMFSGYMAGIPVASISPSYTLATGSPERLKAMVALIDPGLIFVPSHEKYRAALALIGDAARCRIVSSDEASCAENHLPFSQLLSELDRAAVEAAYESVEPETIARLLFTSGSTGLPKAVVNTHRNICSNMAARSAC